MYDLGLQDIPQGLRETIPYRDVPFLRPERVRQAASGGRQVPVDVFLNSEYVSESLAPGVDQLGAGSFAEVKYLLPAVARLYDVLFHFE
eukprot:SAG31_NODE_17821_length_656_cov_1.831239_1_plen_88_part_01